MIANEAYRKLEELRRYLLIVKTAMHDDLYIEFDRKVAELSLYLKEVFWPRWNAAWNIASAKGITLKEAWEDERRYQDMPSHDPNYPYMIWDWVDNGVIAYCLTEEGAAKITKSLNDNSPGFTTDCKIRDETHEK